MKETEELMTVVKIKSEGDYVDLLEGCDSWEIAVDDCHGKVALIDMLPRLVPAGRTADAAMVRAARTSTGKGLKTPAEDRSLVRYMYSHHHSSPAEQIVFTFFMSLPLFVARQLIRHRTARVNEYSLRYAEAQDKFWFPQTEAVREQGTVNKQGSGKSLNVSQAEAFIRQLESASSDSMRDYEAAVGNGVSRELARVVLPVNLYTQWVWQMDASNLLKMLSLRQDSHAQAEIRNYADAIYLLVKPLIPDLIDAYDDYNPLRGGLAFSSAELELLQDGLSLTTAAGLTNAGRFNRREAAEFLVKLRRIGYDKINAEAYTSYVAFVG